MKFIDIVKRDFKLTAIIGICLLLPGFIYAVATADMSLFLFMAGLYVASVIGVFWNTFYGRHRHKAVVKNHLHGFGELGLEIENFHDYMGYKGIYKGYLVRIYYDYDEIAHSSTSSSEICFILYYTMPDSGHAQVRTLRRLQDKYPIWKPFSFDNTVIRPDVFRLDYHVPFRTIMSPAKFKQRLDEIIAVAVKEGLPPMSEAEFIERSAKDPYGFAPNIDTFTDHLEMEEHT